MSQNTQPVHVHAVAHARARVHMKKLQIAPKTSSKVLTDSIFPKIESENCTPYAIDMILPTNIPGVQKTRSFASGGRDLQNRRVAISVLPDRVSVSIAASEDGGKKWHCAGVVSNRAIAVSITDAWMEGIIELPFENDDN